MNEDSNIENRIKYWRKQKRLSQEELAEKLGLSRQSIIAFEQGKFLPSLPIAASMCQLFESSFEDMFDFGQRLAQHIEESFESDKPINIKIINTPVPSGGKESTMPSELEPWRPFREMVSLRDAMDRLFEDSVITPKGGAAMAMPKIDIKDAKDKIIVKAQLPGVKEEDIDIEIADGVMTISGKTEEEKETEEEGYYHKESHSGSFSRSFTLPAEVKGEKAEADMKNGILIINVPKIEPKKATKIAVKKK